MKMHDFLVEDLKKSGLAPEDMPEIQATHDGYIIPFLSSEDKTVMKDVNGKYFVRKRLANPKPGGPKYLSESGAGIRCYLLPQVHQYLQKDSSAPIFMTEGEKKAVRGTKEGLPTIGLVGIWGWLESKDKRQDGEYTINNDIVQYIRSPRPVYIIFDSDATAANKANDFDQCAQKLASELQVYRCPLYRLNLPSSSSGGKQGLDDFFVNGGTLSELKTLIKHASLVNISLVVSTSETIWSTPGALTNTLESAPECPLHALPAQLRKITEAISTSLNVPPEMTVAALLGMLSIAIGNKTKVLIKNHDHQQFANLFFMIAAPVSAGKSPLAKEIQGPIIEIQKGARKKWEDEIELHKIRNSIIEDRIKELRQPINKKDTNLEEVTQEIFSLRKSQKEAPTEPTYIVDDATSEALACRMKAAGGALGVFSGEARKIVSIACGKYGGLEDIDLWLKGHAGDYLKIERISRESIEIPEACLSAVIMTQPDSLKILAKHGAMVESGFLARWIYIVPDISPGAYPVEEIPTKIREDYFSLVQRLVNSNSSQEVKLSPEAFSAWRTAHDREKILIYEAQRNGNYLLAQWISKLPEQIARLALVLCLSQEKHSLVDRDNMCYAIRWGDFFKSHAQRAFSLMDSNNNKLTTALKVWNWIHKKREFLALKREKEGLEKIEAVKARDLQNAGVANIHDSETAKGILSLLEGKGYLNSKRVKQRGIMEQTIYEIIPTTFIENASDKPDKSDNRDF